MRHILSIDAETNGLHGQVFAIGAMLVSCKDDYTERETCDFFLEASRITNEVDDWVSQNVLPVLKRSMRKPMIEWGEPMKLIRSFAEFYNKCRELKPEVVVFCGYPMETNLFGVLKDRGHIGEYDHPLPLIDIATIFSYLGFKDPVSMEKNYEDITGKRFESVRAHDPLYDAQTQLDVYVELKRVFHESQTNL